MTRSIVSKLPLHFISFPSVFLQERRGDSALEFPPFHDQGRCDLIDIKILAKECVR